MGGGGGRGRGAEIEGVHKTKLQLFQTKGAA